MSVPGASSDRTQPVPQANATLAAMPDQDVGVDTRGLPSRTRRALVALTAMTGFGLLAGSADAKKKKNKKKKKKKSKSFVLQALNMKGSNEVAPNPGDPLASGTASFTVDPKGSVCATFTFQTTTPNSTVTMTHIHQGGPTVNGPIVIDFHGMMQECVPVTDKALLADLKANPGGYYANIHTNNFSGGAVRENLVEAVKA